MAKLCDHLLNVREGKAVLLRYLVEGTIVYAEAESTVGFEREKNGGAIWRFAGLDDPISKHGRDMLKEESAFDGGRGSGALIRRLVVHLNLDIVQRAVTRYFRAVGLVEEVGVLKGLDDTGTK